MLSHHARWQDNGASIMAAWDAQAAEVALLRAAEQHAAETCRALRAEVAEPSRGTDTPLGGVVEEAAPRVWRVGDVVEGAEAYASLPVGTTVWQWGGAPGSDGFDSECFWTKGPTTWAGWVVARFSYLEKRVIRSLPAAPAADAPFDAAAAPVGTVVECVRLRAERRFVKRDGPTWMENGYWWCGDGYVSDAVRQYDARDVAITYPPAPAERQPCAAWEPFRTANGQGWRLAHVKVVPTLDGWRIRGGYVDTEFHHDLRAAQLAAEDALEAERQELGRLLGKGGA
jgi:hypothetical protein